MSNTASLEVSHGWSPTTLLEGTKSDRILVTEDHSGTISIPQIPISTQHINDADIRIAKIMDVNYGLGQWCVELKVEGIKGAVSVGCDRNNVINYVIDKTE